MHQRYLLIGLLFILTSLSAWSEENSYTFAVVPQQSAKQLAKLWTPVLQHIKETSGINLRFTTAKNIPEFEKRLAEGRYDFAYMNPYHFTVFNDKPGYNAVAVRKDQPIRGIIIVRKDSPISSLEELNNETLAFPSPAAFAASILPRGELKSSNVSFTPKYVSSHDSVYLSVAKGLFKAGGGVKRTFNNTPQNIKDQLKILWTTAPYTPHAIASHPRVDDKIHQKIQHVFIDISQDPKGKVLLKSLKIKHGLIKANNSDWDDVKALGLNVID